MTEQTPPLSQNDQTKLALIQGFDQLYVNLCSFVNKLTLEPTLRSYAAMNLDQGADWIRKAIQVMQINLPEPVAPANDVIVTQDDLVAEAVATH